MKYLFSFIVLVFFINACGDSSHESEKKELKDSVQLIERLGFKAILDSADAEGSILIYDNKQQVFYSNNFEMAETGFLPASTFKIPNTLIALECNVVENDRFIFKWSGEEYSVKNWNQDLNFHDAFHFSCVPCYREIARKIGTTRMNEYLKKFQYGNHLIDSSNLDLFWLEGDFKISQFQQIEFLRKYYNSELPIAKRTEKIAKQMMLVEKTEDHSLLAKTGLDESNAGWYVGYMQTKDNVFFFATHIKPKTEINYSTRKEVSLKALSLLID